MPPIIIDRRLNPSGKNLSNRQRFLQRAKHRIQEAVKKTVANKNLKDITDGKGDDVEIKSKDLTEPSFREDRNTGNRKHVLPGNKEYGVGDIIEKSTSGGGRGNKAGSGDDTEDDFAFSLTRDEFLDFLFDDLELPDFVKDAVKSAKSTSWSRSGFTNSGSPANLNVLQTFKGSIGRRIALNRPSDDEIEELEDLIKKSTDPAIRAEMQAELDRLLLRRKIIPYIDETDLKYNLWTKQPKPISQAVMFCLMDVSGSMGENEKDIAKRFFLLLYLFLQRKYDKIDIRFIRHTTSAQEVDEETFFYDRLSGGTKISSGLTLIQDIIKDQYKVEDWNIYIAQCSDGDNELADNLVCYDILNNHLLNITQYFAYVQISEIERENIGYIPYSIWDTYRRLSSEKLNLQIRKVFDQSSVWKIFAELFKK